MWTKYGDEASVIERRRGRIEEGSRERYSASKGRIGEVEKQRDEKQ